MSSRARVLGVPLDVMSAAELRERSFLLLSSQTANQAITANALLTLDAQNNTALRAACDKAALVLPESAGIRWALTRQKIKTSSIAGIDYAWQLCELCADNDWPIFLLGSSSEVLNAAAQRLKHKIPRLIIGGTHNGFFRQEQDHEIVELIRAARPRLTLVGLGMPKQDIWIANHLSSLPPGLYVGVGGSFDVWAGRLKRAPRWTQALGAEWFYRLYQEPWRWPRILALPQFAWKVMLQKRYQSLRRD